PLLAAISVAAAPLTVTLVPPVAPEAGFNLGTAANPSGATISADSQCLLRDGQPWTPIMGEFHYSRYPAVEWRDELLKMKAGGIDIVATYVFWIHHEEIEGEWNWSGARDLRRFVETTKEVGLHVIVRCGPWCHGEVRNGGLPDWLVARGQARTDDPIYLASTTRLYAQIAAQLRGLLWKDGGPVIGIQLENEYRGPAEHLLTLKRIAREAGLDTPLYTRTGWPELKTPLPFGEILPLHGVYAEGFWDRELTAMPGNYWAGFHFSTLRTDANIANEALGRRETRDAPDIARYPYLTCEIGGGMMSAYHRRILVDPLDIESTTLIKLGSGSTSPGYYMYHGGTNPVGRLSTLMEDQSTAMTYWNDLPVLNYDFHAPLGQYGQIRPQYHRLRRLHLFLQSFGAALARTAVALPDQRPAGRDDLTTLRWSARSDGRRGFLFVNNHERGRTLPPKGNVQFTLAPLGLTFPSQPVTVPSDAAFLWPFNLDLGHGVTLAYATAQPLTVLDDGATRTFVFAETPGIPAEFAFEGKGIASCFPPSKPAHNGHLIIRDLTPCADIAIRLSTISDEKIQIVLLNDTESLALWRGNWRGYDRLFLSDKAETLAFDGGRLRITPEPRSETRQSFDHATPDESLGGFRYVTADSFRHLLVYPWSHLDVEEQLKSRLFAPLAVTLPTSTTTPVAIEPLRPAGPPRTIGLGRNCPTPVAAAPRDADFAAAAVWRIKLPANLNLAANPLLRLHYRGDVARVKIGDTFIMDDFCNGEPLEIGLARHADLLKPGAVLTVEILPLQRGAPIFLPPAAQLRESDGAAIAELTAAELVTRPSVDL
ncbi:MAG TPA: beta-galactosidase, partial [Opitutaceae bacterium]|nr:beta-galactosidase [Opitutaceae bacterium]